jgi:class 3 adenylate cyclase
MLAVLLGLGLLAALCIGGVASWLFFLRWRTDQAELRRVTATFARYLPHSIVRELLARKDEHLYTGRQMRATILVAKIWNFSQLIEQLSPEETLRYLNEFYALAGTSIERRKGVLHRFLDDGVVAIFGVPLEDYEQEDHALRAAINIVRLVSVMHDKWLQQNRKPLRIGIGVNSGTVIAGDAGFAQRREYTVVGNAVSFAHRLAAATSDLNAYIVASRETIEPVAELYNLVPVTGVPLAGVRTLLDASIVRGRKRGEDITMPKAATFAKTVINTPAVEMPDFLTANAHGELPEPAPEPKAPPPPPQPPLRTRPVRREGPERRGGPQRGFDLPELRIPASFNEQDAAPVMPDPPPPRQTYEDHGGPPLPL